MSEERLTNALNFAKEITDFSREGINVLFSNEKPWMNREGNLFDVTMAAHHDAEVYELVGIFILNKISEKYF